MYDNLLIVFPQFAIPLFLLCCQQAHNHNSDAREREGEHYRVDEFHHSVGDENIGAEQSLADAQRRGFFGVDEEQQQNGYHHANNHTRESALLCYSFPVQCAEIRWQERRRADTHKQRCADGDDRRIAMLAKDKADDVTD